jgi:hypothetical protein
MVTQTEKAGGKLEPRPATTGLGISLRGLQQLQAHLQGLFGNESFSFMATRDINTKWVKEVTAVRKCRLLELELPGLVEPDDVGPPMYFISHACASSNINRVCGREARGARRARWRCTVVVPNGRRSTVLPYHARGRTTVQNVC